MNVDPDRESQRTERDLQARVNLVVMGDFTGRASRGVVEPLPPRKLLNVDVDNFARLFAKLSAKLTLTGAALGVVAALALTRVVRSLLYGVTPTDPLTFAAVTATLLLVAFFACWLPARRAARVHPMEALRYE